MIGNLALVSTYAGLMLSSCWTPTRGGEGYALFEEARNIVQRDSLAKRLINFSGDALPVYVWDSTVCFNVGYEFIPKLAFLELRSSDSITRGEFHCFSRKHPEFSELTTSADRRAILVFSSIDSVYNPEYRVVSAMLWSNPGNAATLNDIFLSARQVLYFIVFDRSGRLVQIVGEMVQ